MGARPKENAKNPLIGLFHGCWLLQFAKLKNKITIDVKILITTNLRNKDDYMDRVIGDEKWIDSVGAVHKPQRGTLLPAARSLASLGRCYHALRTTKAFASGGGTTFLCILSSSASLDFQLIFCPDCENKQGLPREPWILSRETRGRSVQRWAFGQYVLVDWASDVYGLIIFGQKS
jgi:hypothetical protein